MGECAYRIKARWPKPIPKKTLGLIKNFFASHQKAYDYWQDHRDQSGEEFWPDFEKNFPAVAQYAKTMYGKDPQELSGHLDFGSGEELDWHNQFEISYEDDSVWHFADWSALADWFKSLGAAKVIWDSEENRLESFEYYNYKEIVEDILKQKRVLPMLMGINTELNELISEHFKS